MSALPSEIPVIDVAPLVDGGDASQASAAIDRACRDSGFFYVVGHGVDAELRRELESVSRRFFARDPGDKMAIRMARGGCAWRGYFPVGAELTSGRPDQKEGLYFGAELGDAHPAVRAGLPLHGANLWPDELPELRDVVLAYMRSMTELGHALVRGLAVGLGLEPEYFARRYTADPLILFRIFHYPPLASASTEPEAWSVGEHTDYGLLTILQQDDAGGLEVRSRRGWMAAPPIPESFVCNIGDMLDRMTGGSYRSTPHRVRNTSGRGRLSFPFFFDPSFGAQIAPIPGTEVLADDRHARWDRASVHEFSGTYGEYLLAKVGRVFPGLGRDVL